jgi:hypothetical protein
MARSLDMAVMCCGTVKQVHPLPIVRSKTVRVPICSASASIATERTTGPLRRSPFPLDQTAQCGHWRAATAAIPERSGSDFVIRWSFSGAFSRVREARRPPTSAQRKAFDGWRMIDAANAAAATRAGKRKAAVQGLKRSPNVPPKRQAGFYPMATTQLSIRVDLKTGGQIGPGKIALLEAISKTGSITPRDR